MRQSMLENLQSSDCPIHYDFTLEKAAMLMVSIQSAVMALNRYNRRVRGGKNYRLRITFKQGKSLLQKMLEAEGKNTRFPPTINGEGVVTIWLKRVRSPVRG